MPIRRLIGTLVPKPRRLFFPFTLIASGSSKNPVQLRNINLIGQEAENWCWAACAAMVLTYYDLRGDQCDLVSRWLGRTCCPATPGECDVPLNQKDVLNFYAGLGIQGKHRPYWIAHHKLLEELGAGRPVQVAHVSSKGGHASLVIGGGTDSEWGEYVYIVDPALGAERAGFRAYESLLSTGQRSWMDNWTLWR